MKPGQVWMYLVIWWFNWDTIWTVEGCSGLHFSCVWLIEHMKFSYFSGCKYWVSTLIGSLHVFLRVWHSTYLQLQWTVVACGQVLSTNGFLFGRQLQPLRQECGAYHEMLNSLSTPLAFAKIVRGVLFVDSFHPKKHQDKIWHRYCI